MTLSIEPTGDDHSLKHNWFINSLLCYVEFPGAITPGAEVSLTLEGIGVRYYDSKLVIVLAAKAVLVLHPLVEPFSLTLVVCALRQLFQ